MQRGPSGAIHWLFKAHFTTGGFVIAHSIQCPGGKGRHIQSCLSVLFKNQLGETSTTPLIPRELQWFKLTTCSDPKFYTGESEIVDGCCFLQSQHVEMRCCCSWQTTVQKKNLPVSNVTFASEVTKKSSVISSDINQLNCPYVHTQQ